MADSQMIDKDYLYGKFQSSVDREVAAREEAQLWRERVAEMAARKALDLPIDRNSPGLNTGINVHNGVKFGWKELLAIGGLGIAGMGTYLHYTQPQTPTVIEQPKVDHVDTDTDTSFDVQWAQ